MKKIFIIGVVAVLTAGLLSFAFTANTVSLNDAIASGRGRHLLANETVEIAKMPATVEEFTAMRDELAKGPKGGYAMFVVAMLTYVKNKDLGLQFFTLIMEQSNLTKSCRNVPTVKGYCPNSSAIYKIKMLDTRLYLPGVYLVGTKVENGYKYTIPATVDFRQATIGGPEAITLYGHTTSGNMARPISLRKNNKGIWKAYEFSSMFVGVSKIPRVQRNDDL